MELLVELSLLDSWGFGPSFALACSSLPQPDLASARVISDLGSRLEVVTASSPTRFARLSGRLRHTLPSHQLPTRFRDCQHRGEPGCAIAREERARTKAINKSLRARTKVDPKLQR